MMTRGLILILAIACGAIVANLYYAQTLVPLIGHYLNLNVQWAGFIVTLTQIGYGCGLLFIVPLADLIENRRLITILLCLTLFSIVGIIFAKSSVIFLLFCFLLFSSRSYSSCCTSDCAVGYPFCTRGKSW